MQVKRNIFSGSKEKVQAPKSSRQQGKGDEAPVFHYQ